LQFFNSIGTGVHCSCRAHTGVCCQWRGSASYDSDVHIETFVLRGKFSGEIATEQQPPTVMGKFKRHYGQKGELYRLKINRNQIMNIKI